MMRGSQLASHKDGNAGVSATSFSVIGSMSDRSRPCLQTTGSALSLPPNRLAVLWRVRSTTSAWPSLSISRGRPLEASSLRCLVTHRRMPPVDSPAFPPMESGVLSESCGNSIRALVMTWVRAVHVRRAQDALLRA